MSEKTKNKDPEISLVYPVSESGMRNLLARVSHTDASRSVGGDTGLVGSVPSGNTRARPIMKSEEGTLIKCMSCGHEGPETSFMSEEGTIFSGCDECGNIDRSKFIYYDEDGLIGINESRTSPQDFISDNFVKPDGDKGAPRPPCKKDVLKYKKACIEFFNW